MRPNFQGQYSPSPPKMYGAPSVPQNVPCYRILEGKGVFLDDIMFFPGDVVTWSEEPNKDMEPLNDLARQAITKFFDERESLAKAASASKGMRYIPLRRPIEEERELNSSEVRRAELVKGDGGIPVMGAKKKGGHKASRVDTSGVQEKPIVDLAARKASLNDILDS